MSFSTMISKVSHIGIDFKDDKSNREYSFLELKLYHPGVSRADVLQIFPSDAKAAADHLHNIFLSVMPSVSIKVVDPDGEEIEE